MMMRLDKTLSLFLRSFFCSLFSFFFVSDFHEKNDRFSLQQQQQKNKLTQKQNFLSSSSSRRGGYSLKNFMLFYVQI